MCPWLRAQEQENIYYKDLTHKLHLQVNSSLKFNSLEIEDNSTGSELEYKPFTPIGVGFGFSYKKIGFGASYELPNTNLGGPSGESKYFDVQVNSYGKKLGFDVVFSKYTGYYLNNQNDYPAEFPLKKVELIERPDLKTGILSIVTYYNLNHKKFSYRSSFNLNEIQLKSAGSPIVGLYLFGFGFGTTDSASVIPSALTPDNDPYKYFDKDLHVKSLISYNIGANAGYAYTFVFRKSLFVTLSLTVGAGYESTTYRVKNQDDWKDVSFNMQAIGRYALGYQNNNFFVGISGVLNNISNRQITNNGYKYEIGSVKLAVGKRFSGEKISKLFTKKKK